MEVCMHKDRGAGRHGTSLHTVRAHGKPTPWARLGEAAGTLADMGHVQRKRSSACARSLSQGERRQELVSAAAGPPCPSTNLFPFAPVP